MLLAAESGPTVEAPVVAKEKATVPAKRKAPAHLVKYQFKKKGA